MKTIRHYYDQLKETHPDQWSAFNAELARMDEIDYFKRFVLKEEPRELHRKRFNVVFLVITLIPGIDAEQIFQAAGLPLPTLVNDSLNPVNQL